MLCPACNVNLLMTERLGVEIDYCPQCRGVWLDRGELDKIIDRADNDSPAAQPAPQAPPPPPQAQQPVHGYAPPIPQQPYAAPRRDHDDDDDYRKQYGYSKDDYKYKKKKHKSWLGDLLDFD